MQREYAKSLFKSYSSPFLVGYLGGNIVFAKRENSSRNYNITVLL